MVELPGNRREEIDEVMESVARTYGRSTRMAVRRIEYIAELDRTRIVYDPESPAWRAYFADRLVRDLTGSD